MENSKLNAIQTYLFNNGVEYYDVQAELIDHFATAVEKAEKENPNIPFKEALIKAHRAFGGREGFRKYIEAAETRVTKKTFALIGHTFVRFVSWPYLVITFSFAAMWYWLFQNLFIQPRYYFVLIMLAFIGVVLRNTFTLRNSNFFLAKKTSRSLGWVAYLLLYLPGGNTILFSADTFSPIFLTIYFTILTLALVAFWRIPHLATQEARKLYPEIA